MDKNKTQVLIQQEREKRQAQLAELQQQQATLQSKLGQTRTMIIKVTGALEQLDELEPSTSNNGILKRLIESKKVGKSDA